MENEARLNNQDISILNVIIGTPESRMGAVRAGLLFGEHLSDILAVDSVKMSGKYDEQTLRELSIDSPIYKIPSKTMLRDLFKYIIGSEHNYSNALIWTKLDPPKPLESYDFVHIHNAIPLAGMVSVALSCRAAGVPYCVTMHGISKIPELPESMGMSRPVKLAFQFGFLRPYWWVLKNATHLFALSEGDVKTVRQRFPNQSISILPNGVEPNPPQPDAPIIVADEFGIKSSTPILLFVGKLIPSKGIDDLLAAFERLNEDTRLLIVGPTENQSYVDRIKRMPHADYLGYVDQPLLDTLYQRADLFVFPTRSDVFPLVTLEAMAAQTPVVTTEVGGLPEQITDKTGILVPPESPTKLTAALEELLADEKLRSEMGTNAIARVREQFSWRSVVERAATEYKRMYSDCDNSPEITSTRGK
ncbi:glycosyltransferase family 4 protein [Halorarius halobius]|uniref:glycosyltransferase family 4 protein n=1 Tax=Halorarius halobius TaxID=2962671 RepID=UPI0020CD0E29|nr:glycosyltransferase family 4 protein [Halorarius halobius]